MPTSAAGNEAARPRCGPPGPATRGFTLIELLVVVAIMAIASAGIAFALRDNADTLLDREAQRLAALLDAARAQSRASGRAVRWVPVDGGFRFEGQIAGTLPSTWLDAATRAAGSTPLVLGPEPLIPPQEVLLVSSTNPARRMRVATDGLRPFTATAAP